MVPLITPAINNPVWPIEGWAASDFVFVCRRVTSVMNDPYIEVFMGVVARDLPIIGRIDVMCRRPHSPSLTRVAARVIGPATGATIISVQGHVVRSPGLSRSTPYAPGNIEVPR